MGFVLYRSSAGSGKTFTLVKEYLKLVLENPENLIVAWNKEYRNA
jgi:ATP-dependent exoDNAse (exonuclease V) beta subunit